MFDYRSKSIVPLCVAGGRVAACAVFTFVCAAAAHAQASPGGSFSIDVTALPRYPGASAYRVLPLPALSVPSQSQPGLSFFAEGLDGGVAWALGPHLSVGPLVGFGIGRKQDDAAILNGTGDNANSFLYGAFARWQDGRAGASVKFLQSAHAGYGNHVTLGASYVALQLPQDRVTVSADTVWANGPAEQTDFGVDDAQALNSVAHLPVYAPSAGFSRVDVKVALEHRLDAHWSLRASAGVGTLLGDAANSPLVERRADLFGSFGVAYRF